MLVCHCKRVRDGEIREAIRTGARTRNEVARACGAGSSCAGCAPAIDELIDDETRRGQLPIVDAA